MSDFTPKTTFFAEDDTIFALASGVEKAAIAILRVSGPKSKKLIEKLSGRLPKPRYATLSKLWCDAQKKDELLDEAIILWFPGPHSYTGEDSLELHLHAGKAVIEDVCQACADVGARPAEPGEFSRRAFINGRMDLIQAEGVADLIAADTQAQKQLALTQAGGALSRLYETWRHELKNILAFSEALIDFSDEELPEDLEEKNKEKINALITHMKQHIDEGKQGDRLRRGLVIAIAGEPNVGKSTFLNWICQKDAAITSPIAGTTRDALEVTTVINGIKVTFVDTAGLRETDDIVEAEGVRRAMFHVKHCDFVIQIFSPQKKPSHLFEGAMLIGNKSDLGELPPEINGEKVSIVSFKNQTGLEELRRRLRERITDLTSSSTATPYMTRARHSAAVKEASQHLKYSLDAPSDDIKCEELRLAMNALGRLTGRVNTEELLDSIFGEFCIGK